MYQSFRVLVPLFCLVLWLGEGLRSEPRAKAARSRRVSLDRHGDPLPRGAIARMGTVGLRHPGPIEAGMFVPDGKLLITAGSVFRGDRQGATIRLWNASDWHLAGELTPRRTVNRHGSFGGIGGIGGGIGGIGESAQPVPSRLALSQGGTMLASCGPDARIDLWDLSTRKLLRRMRKPSFLEKVACTLAFSPTGKTLACCEESIELWDVATGKQVRRFGKQDGLRAVAFSPDGKTLISAANTIRTWNVATGKELRRFRPGPGCVALSADGKWAALGSESTGEEGKVSVTLWEVASGKKKRLLWEGEDGIHALAFSPDSKLLSASDDGGTLRVWMVHSGKELWHFQDTLEGNLFLTFSPDGKVLASGGANHLIRLWDLTSGKELAAVAAHEATVVAVSSSRDGKLVASASADGTVRLWEAATGKPVRVLRGHEEGATAVAFFPDGRRVATGSGDGTLRCWDVATGKEISRLEGPLESVASLSVSADGRSLVVRGIHDNVRVWFPGSGKVVGKSLDEAILDIATEVVVSPNGKWAASRFSDETTAIWEVSTGKFLGRLKRNERTPRPVAEAGAAGGSRVDLSEEAVLSTPSMSFSPNGQRLVRLEWEDEEASARIWDVTSRKEFAHFTVAGLENVRRLVFSPDNRLLAVADEDTIGIWEVASGKAIRRFKGSTDLVTLAFAPDGRTLASAGGGDYAILVWDVTGLATDAKAQRNAATQADLSRYWSELAGDAPRGCRAVWGLVSASRQAVPFLHKHLRPVSSQPERVRRLIRDLGDRKFAARRQASLELVGLGELAEAGVRQALRNKPPLEVYYRLRKILHAIEFQRRVPPPEQLRQVRAVWVLEQAGTPPALRLLRDLAGGTSEARLTREAKAACLRLDRRH